MNFKMITDKLILVQAQELLLIVGDLKMDSTKFLEEFLVGATNNKIASIME